MKRLITITLFFVLLLSSFTFLPIAQAQAYFNFDTPTGVEWRDWYYGQPTTYFQNWRIAYGGGIFSTFQQFTNYALITYPLFPYTTIYVPTTKYIAYDSNYPLADICVISLEPRSAPYHIYNYIQNITDWSLPVYSNSLYQIFPNPADGSQLSVSFYTKFYLNFYDGNSTKYPVYLPGGKYVRITVIPTLWFTSVNGLIDKKEFDSIGVRFTSANYTKATYITNYIQDSFTCSDSSATEIMISLNFKLQVSGDYTYSDNPNGIKILAGQCIDDIIVSWQGSSQQTFTPQPYQYPLAFGWQWQFTSGYDGWVVRNYSLTSSLPYSYSTWKRSSYTFTTQPYSAFLNYTMYDSNINFDWKSMGNTWLSNTFINPLTDTNFKVNIYYKIDVNDKIPYTLSNYNTGIEYITGDDGGQTCKGNTWQAQTFTTSSSFKISAVKIKVYRIGNPNILTVSIRNVVSGKPSGSDLTSGTYNANLFTTNTNGDWYIVNLTPYTLSASTQYAIVLRALTGDDSNKVIMRVDTTSPTYSGGSLVVSLDGGSTWTIDTNIDHMFQLFGQSSSVRFKVSFNAYNIETNALIDNHDFYIYTYNKGESNNSTNGVNWIPLTYQFNSSVKSYSMVRFNMTISFEGYTFGTAFYSKVYLYFDQFSSTWVQGLYTPQYPTEPAFPTPEGEEEEGGIAGGMTTGMSLMVGLILPISLILLPSMILGKMGGYLGAFFGLVIGFMIAVLAGILPMWAIYVFVIILFIGVIMLIKGGIRSR